MSLVAKICVSVICYRDDGKILMVEENRNGKMTINIPSGGVEYNENFEMAASRELHEETGMKALGLSYLGTTVLKQHAREEHGVLVRDPSYLTFVYSVSSDMCEFDKNIWSPKAVDSVSIYDKDVVRAKWMSLQEIMALSPHWRNNLIPQKIEMLQHNKKIKHFNNINLYSESYI